MCVHSCVRMCIPVCVCIYVTAVFGVLGCHISIAETINWAYYMVCGKIKGTLLVLIAKVFDVVRNDGTILVG